MAVIISMLRGVNVGGHHRIRMEALRALYASLGFRDIQTYVQSGNVVFRPAGPAKNAASDLAQLARKIEKGIEQSFGFRPDVILRTTAEMRDVIARNPFAARKDVEPNRLIVNFLADHPSPEAREKVLNLKTDPEELRMDGREIYIYYPAGMARPSLPWAAIDRILKTPGTGRNLNTVRNLLTMAGKLEPSQ